MSSQIDTKPPQNVAHNAEKGLKLRDEHDKGGTDVGVARARDLKNRENLSENTINRMVQYFARHEVDKKADGFGNDNNPSAGYIAWLLWGGDEGKDWAEKIQNKFEKEKDD
ncbi:MAG: hypothetical protein CL565_01765 [Alphaproteobacteria bacterium]|nr:hypothetical protein [Alphaproteobacteria bacterium]|tara:strand:+ start:165 stop:497 length:333 start_codon:yes stop_codon:yes gene_type:complete